MKSMWTSAHEPAKFHSMKAAPTAQRVTIEEVEIPFAALPVLIAPKETYRDQDQVEVRRLRKLLERQRKS